MINSSFNHFLKFSGAEDISDSSRVFFISSKSLISFENLLKNAYAVDWSDASKYYKELDSVKNYALLMGCKKI